MGFVSKMAAVAALALSAGTAAADNYPSRTIELIVPYKAGGLTDAMARKVAAEMTKALPGNPEVVVVNKDGGAGTIGLSAAARAEPDGYTFVFTTSSPIAIQPLYGKVPYTAESFAPIAKITEIPAAFNVHKDSDIRSLDDLVAWAKDHPGEFTFATTGGLGSGTHLVAEDFAAALGIEIRHVPFEGTADMTSALAGQQIMGTVQSPDIHRGGNARPLVYLTNLKLNDPAYADTPTTADIGLDVSTSLFTGFFAPAGTPEDRIAMLASAIEAATQSEEFKTWIDTTGFPVDFKGPDGFADTVETAVEQNRSQLEAMGLIN